MLDNQVGLSDIIGWIESRNNQYALRFEPREFYDVQCKVGEGGGTFDPVTHGVIKRIIAANGCTHFTAQMIFSTSFGAHQIMGYNLYADKLNIDTSIGKFLSDIDMQKSFFNLFVTTHNCIYTPLQLINEVNAIRFATIYNGSSAYAKNIAESLQHFGITNELSNRH